jgi:hypothetical protein
MRGLCDIMGSDKCMSIRVDHRSLRRSTGASINTVFNLLGISSDSVLRIPSHVIRRTRRRKMIAQRQTTGERHMHIDSIRTDHVDVLS